MLLRMTTNSERYSRYTVCIEVGGYQCLHEEGVYSIVTEDIWRTHMMDDGVVEDDYQLRKVQ